MAAVYVKTDAGQGELRDRLLNLPRSARTLLVLVDGTRGAEQLLAMVKGSTAEDIETLVRLKLIATGAASAAAGASANEGTSRTKAAANEGAGTQLEFKELYIVLNELVREQLGMLKAFKYTLEVEKATETSQLLDLAERFAKDVQAAKGDTAAKMVRRALGLSS